MPRLIVWCVALISLVPVLPRVAVSVAATPAYGVNLLLNSGAEASPGQASASNPRPVPDWRTTGHFVVLLYGASGGYPTATDPGPAHRGKNFFSGGGDDPVSTATQAISLSGYAAVIAAATEEVLAAVRRAG